MSTPEEPEGPQLTRRQLRELRNTASNPIITPEEAEAAAASPVVAPLPRAAEPTVTAEEPPADADVDLGVPALTRRSARQQERLRTASVPVVDADEIPEAGEGSGAPSDGGAQGDAADADEAAAALSDAQTESPEVEILDPALEPAEDEDASVADGVDEVEVEVEVVEDAVNQTPDADVAVEADDAVEADVAVEADDAVEADEDGASDQADAEGADDVEDQPRAVVAPTFGSGLLSGEGVELELPASFDQLLSRGGPTGAMTASNALILSQTPDTGSFASPLTATGEVMLTGTFNLPEAFGSTGTSRGSSDGKDIDAILVDGELPPASSPTPIAASSAISTIKSAEDIIKPPAPEKGGRLMLALVITAGALALALTGVLIVALVTGAFR